MKMTGAQAMLKSLEAENVKVMFGYPGAAICPFYDALTESSIKHILTRYEQGAAHAASGYGRVTGKTGVCIATSGPGATNLITGIATAYMDSIPIIAITGQVSSELIGRDVFQEADITGATNPFCKHSYLIKNAADLPRIFKEAFYIASTGRPGPVLIDVPVDIQNQVFDFIYPEKVDIRGYKPKYKGHALQIKKAADAITKAKRPVICSGGGIITSQSAGVLTGLAEEFSIPVVTTLMGIGSIPSGHGLNFGMVGSHGNPVANYIVHNADLLVIAGARVGDRAMGATVSIAKNALIIHIDIDPAEIGKNIGTDIPIVGDAKKVLEDLQHMLQKTDTSKWLLDIEGIKNKYSGTRNEEMSGTNYHNKEMSSANDQNKEMKSINYHNEEMSGANDQNKEMKGTNYHNAEMGGANDPNAGISSTPGTPADVSYIDPAFLMRETGAAAGPDAFITTEVGQNQIWAANHYPVVKPGTFITSGGLGTMGYGLPAAIGVQIGMPGSRVIVVSGDGSFQMCMQELGTIKQENLPVKILLLNNTRLGMVRELQKVKFCGRYSQVLMKSNPDFMLLASAYGFASARISKNTEVRSAIQKMLDHDGAYILECAIDPEEPTQQVCIG